MTGEEAAPEMAALEGDPGWAGSAPAPQADEPVIELAAIRPLTPADPAGHKPRPDRATIAAAARAAGAKRSRSSFLPLALAALAALDLALIAWRSDVVRIAPQTAPMFAAIGLPVNLRGLALAEVATTTDSEDGVPVLVVAGTIASASSRAVEVPQLRISVRNFRGQEVYAWTERPARRMLGPGQRMAFRARLASPPPDARHVMVRFSDRRETVAGVR